jgi:transaldolase
MKLFLDTANVDEIKAINDLGILDGVTTNPSLVAKEKSNFREILKEICRMVKGPVSAEVLATDYEGMIKEGTELAKMADNIVVKVPLIKEGVKAVGKFSSMGIKTNVTLIFSPLQALLAAKAGAGYVSPFVGRLDDVSHEGLQLVDEIITIFDQYEYKTEVLVASVRHPLHLVDAALLGADVATMPFKVFDQMFRHPLTDIGLKTFLSDWEKGNKKI